MKVTVLGCGRWGTFIAWYFDKCGHEVTLWGREGSQNLARLEEDGKNEYISIPPSIRLTNDLQAAVSSAQMIAVSIGAQGLRPLMERIKPLIGGQTPVVLCMKGLEQGSGKRLSVVAAEAAGNARRFAVWLGPGHVQDFAAGIPNCMVIDSVNHELVREICDRLSLGLIRFYYGTDMIGNEIGAAAKNVIGIAAGLLDGTGMTSLKGALMARGTREVSRLIVRLGGNENTVYGLSHLGDYEATLFSPYSNNRKYGEMFIRGENLGRLAEGVYTTKALMALSEQLDVDMPIVSAVNGILFENKTPSEMFEGLFLRSIKHEF